MKRQFLQMFRAWTTLAAMVVTCGLFAGVTGRTTANQSTYIVVLHDRVTAKGTEPGEPDIRALGGEVLHQWRNRRVVRLSEDAVRALVGHRAVQYIQRVQEENELPGVPHPTTPEIITNTRARGAVSSDWAPPAWSSGDYVYDGAGNITAIGTTANPASDGGRESFVYDSADRLVSATIVRGTTQSEKYTYDSFGNLVYTERTAGPSTATPASLSTNRLTMAGVAYDSAGNVLASEGTAAEYLYDAFNMMRAKTSSSGEAWYVYTADDERIGIYENGEQRWTIRDLSGRVLREWEGTTLSWDSSAWLWREDYVYRGSTLTAAERESAQGGTRYFHLDHLNTTRLITDANKAMFALHDYFPYGVEKTDFRQEMINRGTDRPEPVKFTGHERDFTGGISTDNRNQLDYMHARYYNPVWGRFLSFDPAFDLDKTLHSPQLWNRYAYVGNNPLGYVDPGGKLRIRSFNTGYVGLRRPYVYEINFDNRTSIVSNMGKKLMKRSLGPFKKLPPVLEKGKDLLVGKEATTDRKNLKGIDAVDGVWENATFEGKIQDAFNDSGAKTVGGGNQYDDKALKLLQSALEGVLDEMVANGEITEDEAERIRREYDIRSLRNEADRMSVDTNPTDDRKK